MKSLCLFFSLCLLLYGCSTPKFNQTIVTSDINNFWKAYNQIQTTQDTLQQLQLLKELYLEPASPGLKDIIEVRRYTAKEFLTAMTSYPKFWESIRENTLNVYLHEEEISSDIQKFKAVYPDLKPATIYFTVGAFRTNGTIKNQHILIGSELAMADSNTQISELPEWRQPYYRAYKPLQNLSLLCTHEYVHTQQNEFVENLLSLCLYEGIAEYVSCKVTGKASTVPAIEFGKQNEQKVVNQFVNDLYLMSVTYNWLWGENRNHLKVRDLGYYIGYKIAKRYVAKSKNKQQAIKELIELDYTNETEVERIVDASKFLPKSLAELEQDYESKRPEVIDILEFENGSQAVDPKTKSITVIFSDTLNGIENGLDYGPMGEEYYPKVENNSRAFSKDLLSYTFEVELEANKTYQLIIGSNFRLKNGIRLKPYLITFKTKKSI